MWRIFLTVSLLCWSADGQDVTCKNHNGVAVDWYIIYKAPKLNNIRTEGLEYLYIDPAGKKTYKDHNKLINNDKGVLANTLKPIFTKSMTDNFGFITYNDQPPPDEKGVKPSVASKFGHSKGVVMMDKTTGVWLLHSVPQFPFKRDKNNFYPDSGAAKAQTFICVTFKYNQFKKIGQHLLDIRAFPFDHQIPEGFYTELKDVRNKMVQTGNNINIQDLTSAGLTSAAGTLFRSFAKKQYKGPSGVGKLRHRRVKVLPKAKPKPAVHKTITKGHKAGTKGPSAARLVALRDPKRFVGDLYLTIAETYRTDVRVQTWGCQLNRDSSYCVQNQRQVINIESVKTDLGNGEFKWMTKNDHSKWCVADTKHSDLICIADVNRAITQYERPGGGLCFEHKEASELFKGLIDETETCRLGTITSKHRRDTDSDADCDVDDPDAMDIENDDPNTMDIE
ncbi:deoxyribonuclease-2-beta-like [Sander vitreus]